MNFKNFTKDNLFSEPRYHSEPTPYFKSTHFLFRNICRRFIEQEILLFVDRWDELESFPVNLHEKAYQVGIYGYNWPIEYGGTPPEDKDFFHDFVFYDEISRCASGGLVASLFVSFDIALPPIIKVGSNYLKNLVCRNVITGKKLMALGITEPSCGSDVINMKTTAIRDGNYFIINGEKMFITGGVKASFYTIACRTTNSGTGGISLFLIERERRGIYVQRQKTQGWWCSNTAYFIFKNVYVPIENLIGEFNKGFKLIMHNFNHERWGLSITANRFSRICLTEAVQYARKRKTFGKFLIKHQVIRHKCSEMARNIDASEALLEKIGYLFETQKTKHLPAHCALGKIQATKTLEFCARESAQIFGGRAFLRTGRGRRVERIYREVRVYAIGGGSEEIMLDLYANQAKL